MDLDIFHQLIDQLENKLKAYVDHRIADALRGIAAAVDARANELNPKSKP